MSERERMQLLMFVTLLSLLVCHLRQAKNHRIERERERERERYSVIG